MKEVQPEESLDCWADARSSAAEDSVLCMTTLVCVYGEAYCRDMAYLVLWVLSTK